MLRIYKVCCKGLVRLGKCISFLSLWELSITAKMTANGKVLELESSLIQVKSSLIQLTLLLMEKWELCNSVRELCYLFGELIEYWRILIAL